MVRSTMRMFMNELYDWSYKAKIYSSSLFAGFTLHVHCLVKGFANDRGGYLAGRPGVKWRRGPGNCLYWNSGCDRRGRRSDARRVGKCVNCYTASNLIGNVS